MTGQRGIEELLHHWPAVLAAAPEGWARGFALSIQRSRNWPNWHPSAKQEALMQRMVSELFAAAGCAQKEDIER